MSRKISVVTTFNQRGLDLYGRRMIDTFLTNWPSSIELYVYAEDCKVDQTGKNLIVRDLHSSVPELVAFKQKWGQDPKATGKLAQGPVDRRGKQPGIGFRWDAVRFSHKVYAMCDHVRRSQDDVVIWMDADMVCHSAISEEFVLSQIPADVNVAFLGRKKKFTETGLYALNLSCVGTRQFVDLIQTAYDNAENGVLAMDEYHDCWVFDRSRERMPSLCRGWRELNWNQGNIQAEGHPLVNSVWGAYLDHLKGNRKDQGRSSSKDLVNPRVENYWQIS